MKKLSLFFKAMFSLSRTTTPVEYRYAALLFLDIVAIIYFSVCQLPHQVVHYTVCIIKNITGYPCPACGTTRGLKFFFHFMPYQAFMLNPLSIMVGVAMILIILWSIHDFVVQKPTLFETMHKRIPWYLVVLIVVFVVLNEIWNINKAL